MSSIDDGDGFPDDPLSRAGVAIFVGVGMLIVGLLLVIGINALFPLRPPSLACDASARAHDRHEVRSPGSPEKSTISGTPFTGRPESRSRRRVSASGDANSDQEALTSMPRRSVTERDTRALSVRSSTSTECWL